MAEEKKAKAAKTEKSGKKSEKSDKKKSKKNPFKSIGSFFKSVKSEGKKVVWPNAKEVWKNTLVVLVVILIIGVVIFAIDSGLTQGMKGLKKYADERKASQEAENTTAAADLNEATIEDTLPATTETEETNADSDTAE